MPTAPTCASSAASSRSVSEYSIPACRLEWDWISFQDVELDCDGSESEVSRFRIQAE